MNQTYLQCVNWGSSCRYQSFHILITPGTSTSIECVIEFDIIDMNLMRVDPNDWAYPSQVMEGKIASEKHTVYFVHALNLIEELSLLHDIEVELINLGRGSEFWSWELGKRVEVEVVDDAPSKISYTSNSETAEDEQCRRGGKDRREDGLEFCHCDAAFGDVMKE